MAGLVPAIHAFAEQVETVDARHKAGHDGQAACSLVSALGARISTEPPACSTAATADLEAPNTESVTLALISPSPSSRTPSLARRRMPALTIAAASILAAASSRPESIAACSLPRFTSLSLRANLTFLKPRLGSRRCSGIWPPSKPLMRTPERAVWPLPPRPPVLPVPEPMPRPMRARFLRAPGRSESSCSFIAGSSFLSVIAPPSLRPPQVQGTCRMTRILILADHAHEVLDLGDHAAGRRRVGHLGGASDPVELEPDQGLALGVVAANGTADLLDGDLLVGFAHSGLPALSRTTR